ncbi:TetR/AcrR family transcriptional regulator [Candidatus Cyanaurora vandensis]|uniref:TetR/AcrR family transcriptional regulator n=1 Tax=Candidatus Cyanaurora vandensis TaxID=2714958 RepID=UPI00257F2A5E|nr:TetR/AcrR family transcriptional regulator [Candidatus Cyanaurora vandensis]
MSLAREEVVARLVPVFRRYGYEGASLAELAKATGLGRSSLYHYFPGGKEDMARAALESLGGWLEQHLLTPLRGPGLPAERLDQAVIALGQLYGNGKEACLLGMLVHGESRHLFQTQLRDSFLALITALAALMAETGIAPPMAHRRAEEAVVRIQGALILAGGLGDEAPFQRVLQSLKVDLLANSHSHNDSGLG